MSGPPLPVLAWSGAILTGFALASQATPNLALINESASLPKGVYIRLAGASPRRGSVVSVPQPGQARPYLARLGVPAEIRLLKRIAAVGGDPACAAPGALLLPNREIPVLARDRRGVVLPVWRQCRRLAADELLLLGDSATSFDSRHFGPVRRDAVTGPYVLVLPW